jgi:hypothetical protein
MSPVDFHSLLSCMVSGPTSEGTLMFEQEIEMEKKEGAAFGPILIILVLVGLFVGSLGVVIFQSKRSSPKKPLRRSTKG